MKYEGQLQLQFWNGREYVRSDLAPDPLKAGFLAKFKGWKGWRICKSDRPLKPTATFRTPHFSTSGYDIDRVIAGYLAWAESKGLTCVTFFSNQWRGRAAWEGKQGREIKTVDYKGYFDVAIEHEPMRVGPPAYTHSLEMRA